MTIRLDEVRWSAAGRMIVDGVTLEVAPGTTLGLVGPNGSGKSSLLRLIGRLRPVASGVISLGGTDVASLPRLAIARRVALVEQQATTDAPISALDIVRLGRTPHLGPLAPWTQADSAAVESALDHTGLAALGHRPWHTLSGGERQRVHIARALAQEPRELLLDEPTNHLDIQHQLEILALVRRLPATVVVALHDLNLAAMFCDAVVMLDAGRVAAAGPPEAVLTEDRILSVFGVRAQVSRSAHHGRLHIQYGLEP
ncbi:MAG: ABC transporter ATP-binding protein [Janthinobacterium lividum]